MHMPSRHWCCHAPFYCARMGQHDEMQPPFTHTGHAQFPGHPLWKRGNAVAASHMPSITCICSFYAHVKTPLSCWLQGPEGPLMAGPLALHSLLSPSKEGHPRKGSKVWGSKSLLTWSGPSHPRPPSRAAPPQPAGHGSSATAAEPQLAGRSSSSSQGRSHGSAARKTGPQGTVNTAIQAVLGGAFHAHTHVLHACAASHGTGTKQECNQQRR